MVDLTEQLTQSEKKIATLDADIKAASAGREDSVSDGLFGLCIVMVTLQAERLTLLTRLEEMTSRRKQLSTELDKYKDCDPERVNEVREYIYLVFYWMMSLIYHYYREGNHSGQGCC